MILKTLGLALGVLLLDACSSGSDCYVPDPCYCLSYVDCSYRTGVKPGSLDSRFGGNGTCFATSTTLEACCQTCNDGIAKFKMDPAAMDAGCTFTHSYACQ
jgi:hypothetical protein